MTKCECCGKTDDNEIDNSYTDIVAGMKSHGAVVFARAEASPVEVVEYLKGKFKMKLLPDEVSGGIPPAETVLKECGDYEEKN